MISTYKKCKLIKAIALYISFRFNFGMDDVEQAEIVFKKPTERKNITIWFQPEVKDLYDLLGREYGVDVSEDLRRIIEKRLRYLADKFIKPAA